MVGMLKSGPGSGGARVGAGRPAGSGSGEDLTGDTHEAGAARSRVVSEWAQQHGVTGSREQALIAGDLKRGHSLKESVKRTYDRVDRERRNAMGDDLYNQLVAEGELPRPDVPSRSRGRASNISPVTQVGRDIRPANYQGR